MTKLQKIQQQQAKRQEYQKNHVKPPRAILVPIRISGIYNSVFCKGEK